MKIAFIDKKDALLKVENKILKVDEQKIPLRLLDTIVLASSCCLESRDMVKMTAEGISLLLLSGRGDAVAVVHSSLSKNAELKLAQYKAQSKALEIAKYFVSEKIKRHAEQLGEHEVTLDIFEVLEKVENAENIEILLGIEGSFSRLYFSHYFTFFSKRLHCGKRSRNPPQDPVNAMMSFVYMMTYNLITVRLLSFGFEPSIGFLHKPFRSHNALASDFMELFRADVNAFVFRIFNEKLLESTDFTKNNGVYLKYEARKRVWVEFKGFMHSLEAKLDHEIAELRARL
jgi:CRISPR-associated protein Cas1